MEHNIFLDADRPTSGPSWIPRFLRHGEQQAAYVRCKKLLQTMLFNASRKKYVDVVAYIGLENLF